MTSLNSTLVIDSAEKLSNLRSEFPLLSQNTELIYLDNAATTQKPEAVLQTLDSYYRESNSNVHRSVYSLAQKATEAFEGARETVRSFLNAHSTQEIIFTRGTTEALNLLAHSLCALRLKEGDIIISTELEHHANFVPWQQAAKRHSAQFLLVPLDSQARLKLDFLEKLEADGRAERVGVLVMGYVSNAFGTVNPVRKAAQWCQRHNIPLVLDAAQAAAHIPLDVQELGADFVCFSGHKMYGPMGSGVLWGRESWLERMPPWQTGGDMISSVRVEQSKWAGLPNKFEAGTPNVEAALGLAAAMDWLQTLGMSNVAEIERSLAEYMAEVLKDVPGIIVYGPDKLEERLGVFSFNLEGLHGHDTAEFLNGKNIAVRSGFHCAQPAMKAVGVPSTCRASLAIYNNSIEIDILADALVRTVEYFS